MKTKFKTIATAFFIILVAVLLLLYPKIISKGIVDGLLMSGNILIPALFPFCVLSIFILKCGILNCFKGKYGKIFTIFLISLIGGYPVGAKIIKDEYSSGLINKRTAKIMLCFCINAGPAFIYTFAGVGVLQNRTAGIILLVSHIFTSFQIFMLLLLLKILKFNFSNPVLTSNNGIATVFVDSVAAASKAIISICSFTVIFSGLIELLKHLNFGYVLIFFLEVTNGIVSTKNIYLISFLLGFGGLCVVMQIYSVCNSFCNIIFLICSRVLHGIISVINTIILMKLLNCNTTVFSNINSYNFRTVGATTEFSLMLIITAIIFLVSLANKTYSGKVLRDSLLS